MIHWTPRFILNLIAIVGLLAGGLISFHPAVAISPELQGALWGALVAWLASAKTNGVPT